ncbi:peroxiredoxin family protein [Rhizosphaericola mali]|uniref:Redoxin domain-containing protein n=1 Tax=Rhizosphaericola mali TaxID=2545455 RepID=A0A5P2FVF4_9BACT|nr:TlpA disulfide reductase family protein [Rhizosphaericola mali]QES87474.1 redoxin domain-containing protein [Rhizosphaericola mali]
MKAFLGIFLLLIGFSLQSNAYDLTPGKWHAAIHREDGKNIVFTLAISKVKNQTTFSFINGKESLKTTDIQSKGDSLIVHMPVFESFFRLKIINKDSLQGDWVRNGISAETKIPFTATAKISKRFPYTTTTNAVNASGKWALNFSNDDNKPSPAIGVFQEKNHIVTGSILTPTGDYRFLEGVTSGDSILLSTFDGVHALVFAGKINIKDSTISGNMISGAKGLTAFTGKKDLNPQLPNTSEMYVKDGESGKLNFTFKDLNGKEVSINDPKFKNKVVIIDLMGSWCPNCMDETAFLSDFYKKNKARGVEVIGLAYEYTTDYERSVKSLTKFQKKFDVQYPMLITGVSVADPKRTEKTLPELTDIKMFPSTIILDKTGKVAFIDTGFEGPGTGEYYTKFVKEFDEKIDKLLK